MVFTIVPTRMDFDMTNTRRARLGHAVTGRVRAVLVALSLFTAQAALADARAEAKRHYKDGMALIGAGQLERGIEELKAAYAIKPHPDVLYNVARAYVDLGNIPEALRYFRLYVATDPEDKAQVEQVMQRLQAAIQTAPEQKPQATNQRPAQTTQQPSAGNVNSADAQALLAQLAEMLAKAKAAQAPAEPSGPAAAPALPAAPTEEEMFAPTEISAESKATAKEIAQELSGQQRHDEDLFEELVVTAGVRASGESRAPASLTVITEEEIRLSGATTIPELLRRVPGIDVAEMNPSDTNISIRGFNQRVADKVLVLVDGRSVYQDFLGNTLWPDLDVAIPEIARIEVIRGPGSALYGAGAFSGVVNIITKSGDEAAGVHIWAGGGTQNTQQGGATMGGKSGKLTYKAVMAYDHSNKWTKDYADDRTDFSSQWPQPDRSREVERAGMNLAYDFGKVQMMVAGGYDNFAQEIVPLGALRSFAAVGNSGFARLEVTSGQTKLKMFWNALRMDTGPEYWPNGIPNLNTQVRSDVVDASAQTGVDFRAAGKHRVNFGVGYRYKTVDWGYLKIKDDGTHRYDENHFNAFLQEDWEVNKQLQIVVSYRVDRHPLLARYDITPGGLVHSPRGTILYEVKPDQVLRFTIGTAFRVPTFLESYIDIFAPIPNQPGIGVEFQGDQKLRPENIIQAELGYRGRIGERFQPEAVVFVERVNDLINDGVFRHPGLGETRDPNTGNYVIGYTGFNNQSYDILGLGAELAGKWQPIDGVDIGVNYSFLRLANCTSGCSFNTPNGDPAAQFTNNTAQHKFNANATWRPPAGIDLGAELHFVSGVTWTEKTFDPSSATGVDLNPYDVPSYTLINARIGYRLFKDKLDLGASVYNILNDQHREHPFGNQIGRRLMITAAGAF
ncbi:MAG: TonB-dependent receptor [Deltaproteobacteria bacterium]|nr:TonB-dependent receptor [Deltaproteobacteria bacterium]